MTPLIIPILFERASPTDIRAIDADMAGCRSVQLFSFFLSLCVAVALEGKAPLPSTRRQESALRKVHNKNQQGLQLGLSLSRGEELLHNPIATVVQHDCHESMLQHLAFPSPSPPLRSESQPASQPSSRLASKLQTALSSDGFGNETWRSSLVEFQDRDLNPPTPRPSPLPSFPSDLLPCI